MGVERHGTQRVRQLVLGRDGEIAKKLLKDLGSDKKIQPRLELTLLARVNRVPLEMNTRVGGTG